MRFLVLFFTVFNLYALDLANIYHTKGIEEVENILEKRLGEKDYWLERLKDKDVRFGYFESEKFILFCDKCKKSLEVYKSDSNKSLAKFKVLTGLMGDKLKEGDKKTPIGVYKIKAFIDNIDKFYGPFAFVTSYPNLYDRLNGKNGHGIWIHGKPIDSKRDSNDTKGCIVLDNGDLETLKSLINHTKSYLMIFENPFFATKEDIASILAFIYQWKRAWRKSEFERYISFYSDDFKRWDLKDLEAFKRYKRSVFAHKRGQKIKIDFKDISIVPYQNSQNKKIYKIEMKEDYYSPTYRYSGKKELFILLKNSQIKILVEK